MGRKEIMKNRELVVVPQYFYPTYGGLQNFTHRLCQQLVRLGVKITIIAPKPESGRQVIEQDSDPDYAVFRINANRDQFWQLAAKTILRRFPNNDRVFTIGLEYENLIDFQLNFLQALHLKGVKTFIRIATTGDFGDVIKGKKIRMKRINSCRKLIVPTKAMANEIYPYVNNSLSVCVIPNLIDEKIFHPVNLQSRQRTRKKLGLPLDSFLAIWTGRFAENKNLDELLIGWKKANIKGCLALVGSDCYPEQYFMNKLRQLIYSYNIKDISFVGPFPEPQMPSVYSCADVFISTSLREGLCNSTLEAGASGLPIIAYDTPGISEVTDLFPNPLHKLIQKKDIENFALALGELAKNLKKSSLSLKTDTNARCNKNPISPPTIGQKYLKCFFEDD